MSRRRSQQPPDRDDSFAVEHHRRTQPDLATTDDVLGLDAATDGGAEAHGLFDGPGSVVQFGENLLTATGRGFSQFGENVVTAVGSGAKEFLEQGAEAASNLAGRGQDDEGDNNEADNEGDNEGGGEEGGSAQFGPPAGGIAPVAVDIDVDDLLAPTSPDSGSALEFAPADLDLADDLDDGLFSD